MWHKPKHGRISIKEKWEKMWHRILVYQFNDKMLYFTQGILHIQISGVYTHLSTSVDDWWSKKAKIC